jgi:hypothetical protein
MIYSSVNTTLLTVRTIDVPLETILPVFDLSAATSFTRCEVFSRYEHTEPRRIVSEVSDRMLTVKTFIFKQGRKYYECHFLGSGCLSASKRTLLFLDGEEEVWLQCALDGFVEISTNLSGIELLVINDISVVVSERNAGDLFRSVRRLKRRPSGVSDFFSPDIIMDPGSQVAIITKTYGEDNPSKIIDISARSFFLPHDRTCYTTIEPARNTKFDVLIVDPFTRRPKEVWRNMTIGDVPWCLVFSIREIGGIWKYQLILDQPAIDDYGCASADYLYGTLEIGWNNAKAVEIDRPPR